MYPAARKIQWDKTNSISGTSGKGTNTLFGYDKTLTEEQERKNAVLSGI